MQIQDVENMSAVDLAGHKDAILDGLRDADPGELAARYLQARTDAKIRDEKLADQAKTLSALQEGFAAVEQREAKDMAAGVKAIRDLQAEVKRLQDDTNSQADEVAKLKAERQLLADQMVSEAAEASAIHAAAIEMWTEVVAEKDVELLAMTERCDRLAAQAKQSHETMTGAQQVVITSLAAVQEAIANTLRNEEIDKADRGE